jgi:hypothetical protein
MSLILYLEDAPVADGLSSTGLNKAFNATLKGLASDYLCLCIVQTHQLIEPRYFVKEWRAQPAWAGHYSDWLIAKLCLRLPWLLARRGASLHGRWIAWRLQRVFPGLLPPGTRLLVPIGIDPLTLVRADSLARNLSAELEPYLVDDILNHPANIRWRDDLSIALSQFLHKAKKIYCISHGLSHLTFVRHGIRPKTLYLVADSLRAGKFNHHRTDRDAFAFYLGSINHLYADGIRHLIEQVACLREATGQDLKIRICSAHSQVRDQIGAVPQWVIVGRISDESQLHREMTTATFCFLPYSFDVWARSMVDSSFPSKMIDYLAYANAILVFSPDSASPYQLLSSFNLPYVSSNPAMLAEQLLYLLNEQPCLTKGYRDVLDTMFSVTAMRRTLGIEDSPQ